MSPARGTEHEDAQSKRSDEGKEPAAAKEGQVRKKESFSNGAGSISGILDRSKRGSKSMSKRSFSFFHKDKGGGDGASEAASENGEVPERQEKTKSRLSIGLGRKKSQFLS
ncbi:hypothetical protein CDD83_10626 [Cordyceps sp. RAO-2017]|nr:hypothetical protein CDD83_10626 [Cordyceps sp. RAO-2017]